MTGFVGVRIGGGVSASSIVASASLTSEEITVGSDGQTAITLSQIPVSGSLYFVVNHGVYEREGEDFDITGANVTWLDPSGFTLSIGDQVTAFYRV